MFNALLIGCGNIGAGYDWNNDAVLTHAKALYLSKKFSVSFYDADVVLASKVAERYEGVAVKALSQKLYNNADLVIICSPTFSHADYIQAALESNAKMVLCEKPLSYNNDDIKRITDLYKDSCKPVFINYIRRFQPQYAVLRDRISVVLKKEELRKISIRYCRGFLNSCSHALDTLSYLFQRQVTFSKIKCGNMVADVFQKDPTLSVIFEWEKSSLDITGIPHIQYPVFEVDIFFDRTSVRISESGNRIQMYHQAGDTQEMTMDVVGAIQDYMVPVMEIVTKRLAGDLTISDNFLSSAALNQSMLSLLNNN